VTAGNGSSPEPFFLADRPSLISPAPLGGSEQNAEPALDPQRGVAPPHPIPFFATRIATGLANMGWYQPAHARRRRNKNTNETGRDVTMKHALGCVWQNFKTGALNHSATLPGLQNRLLVGVLSRINVHAGTGFPPDDTLVRGLSDRQSAPGAGLRRGQRRPRWC
jgi:hypothetical protein